MRHVVTWNGQKLRVMLPDVVPDGTLFPLTIEDRKYDAMWLRPWSLLALRDQEGVERNFRIRGRQVVRFEGELETQVQAELASGPRLHTVTATVGFDMPGHNAREKTKGDQIVRSQITGKVLKVLVKVGDIVTAGQALLTIEAMKMENRVFASMPGKVQAVVVKEGDPVATGKELFRITQ